MAQEPVQMSKAGRTSRIIVLVILLLPMLCGIIAGNLWMSSVKAGCPMVQSFGAQIGGNPLQRSDTADNCRAAVDAQQGWYTLSGIVSMYLLCAGALMTLIAVSTVAGRRRKPDVVVVVATGGPSSVTDRLASMVDSTVIVGDPSAPASADDSANI